MTNRGPFSRAKSMMAVIAAIMTTTISQSERQAKLYALGDYKSRGKGGKRPHRSVGTAAFKRAAMKERNRRAHRN